MQLQKLILSLISRNTSYKCQEVSFCMYQKRFSSAICMLAVLLLSSGSYYSLIGSSHMIYYMMLSAKSIFRMSIVMLIRYQWKLGLLFACLFIFFKCVLIQDSFLRKLMLKSCRTSSWRCKTPTSFPWSQLSHQLLSFLLCWTVDRLQKWSVQGELFSAAQRIYVSYVTLVIPWGELLSWQPAHQQ